MTWPFLLHSKATSASGQDHSQGILKVTRDRAVFSPLDGIQAQPASLTIECLILLHTQA